ncbi:type II secretion system protein GspJ [Pacificoceanicola onchidii]|uniref:type II secretion system protein GspJ n=1 Tax=Pacificoceanicola onchidii TaxID=2562685 RepID=UPI0010A52030|nr:type II secretion system protein GspJ [Pacificoceanicola onchidii]
MNGRGGGDKGLSLIELVVAMAIFALVAIMGAQTLTGMLRMRNGITARSDDAAALAEATSLLRADMAAAIPMLFFAPDVSYAESAILFESGELGLSVGGQRGMLTGDNDIPLSRVSWRIEDGTLIRRTWPTLTPAATVRPTPDQPVMQGVDALRLRSYLPDVGWVEGLRVPSNTQDQAVDGDEGALIASSYSSGLPLGLEITLITRDYGAIPIVERLQ